MARAFSRHVSYGHFLPSAIEELSKIPSFDGDPAKYRDYRVGAQWLVAGTPDDKRNLLAPMLVRRLGPNAAEHFRHGDPEKYRQESRVRLLLAKLDPLFNFMPEMELQDSTEEFMALHRKRGQGPTGFTSILRHVVARLESVLTQQIYYDAQLDHQEQMSKYRQDLLQYRHEIDEHDQQESAIQARNADRGTRRTARETRQTTEPSYVEDISEDEAIPDPPRAPIMPAAPT